MPNPDAEKNPLLPENEAPDLGPVVVSVGTYEDGLKEINDTVQARDGVSIYELAESDPRSAYVEIGRLFGSQYINFEDENWGIGSVEEDGQMAFDGLTSYVAKKTAPDPDVEEIEVIVSLWKRKSWLWRTEDDEFDIKEVLRFQVSPQDLAF